MATEGRKPSSPLRDALRLLVRNRPAVLAALAISLLAFAAISGELLTGKPPTPEEIAIIEEAEYVGDKVDLDRNSWAVTDPLDTKLQDKLLPPGGSSKADPDKSYLLGTDHLGRNVAARLWAGSSISLTIGFLAVGISVFLGICLGGIAGYWGRQRIGLPFFATLLLLLGGGITLAAEFPTAGYVMFAAAGGCFAFQLFVLAAGQRFGTLGMFGVIAAVFLSINGFNYYVEHADPNGRVMQQARTIQSMARETLLETRDFGTEVKDIEDQAAGARTEEWRRQRQHEVEVMFAVLALEKARFDVIEREAAIELMARRVNERKARAEHMAAIDRPKRVETENALLKSEEERLKKLEEGKPALEEALAKAEAALTEQKDKPLADIALQTSNQLLDRRALMRQQMLDRFRSEADNRFKDGLVDAKTLSGHWRNPVYRVTRHFIMAVVLWLMLLIGVLIVAGQAQATVADIKGPLQKFFLPTMTVDDLVMRFTEIMMTIPVLFLILAVLAMFRKDVYIVMAVIGLTSWMGTTRFVRAEILSLREQDFIQAARSLGVSDFRIIWRHLVPNAISPVLVSATLGVAGAVLAESTLSFLGIGARPDQPTWGQILNDGRAYMTDAWWLMVIPGFAILLTVLSFNLLGEGLREAFNPKLRGR